MKLEGRNPFCVLSSFGFPQCGLGVPSSTVVVNMGFGMAEPGIDKRHTFCWQSTNRYDIDYFHLGEQVRAPSRAVEHLISLFSLSWAGTESEH